MLNCPLVSTLKSINTQIFFPNSPFSEVTKSLRNRRVPYWEHSHCYPQSDTTVTFFVSFLPTGFWYGQARELYVTNLNHSCSNTGSSLYALVSYTENLELSGLHFSQQKHQFFTPTLLSIPILPFPRNPTSTTSSLMAPFILPFCSVTWGAGDPLPEGSPSPREP